MDSIDCKICLRRFKTKYSLKIHMTRHSEEKRWTTIKRETGSTMLGFTEVNTKIDTETKPYKCSHCNMAFVQYGHLKAHCRVHTGEKPFVCVTCGKAFTWQKNLFTHKTIHDGEKSYICKVCGQAFTRKDNLKAHDRIHSEDKPLGYTSYMDSLDCKICLGRFKTKYLLKRHIIRHIENDETCFSTAYTRTDTAKKPYTCSHCNIGFIHYPNLKQHYRVHSGERPFVCVTCGKAFAWKKNLIAHKIVHSGEKPHICKVCRKAFKRKDNLKVHERQHSRDKSKTSETCGTFCTQKGCLNRHEIIHREENSNVCKPHEKAFTVSGTLKKDKIHGGDPHIPPTRRNTLKNISNLKVKKKSDNGEKLHDCKTCGKVYFHRRGLRRHEKVHVEVKSNTTLEEKDINLKSNVNILDKTISNDTIYSCSNCSLSFSTSTELDIHLKSHQIKESDRTEMIESPNTEYFEDPLNVEKEESPEMFSDVFETDFMMDTDVSSALLSPDSFFEIQDDMTQYFEISTEDLHPANCKKENEDLKCLLMEELNNLQRFFCK